MKLSCFSALVALTVLATSLSAQETPPRPPGTPVAPPPTPPRSVQPATPPAPGTPTTEPGLPTPAPGTPAAPGTPPAPGTPAVPGTEPFPPLPPGILPPPGAIPDPTAPGGYRKPKTSTDNDAAFVDAVDSAADFSSRQGAVIKGPVVALEEALRITLLRQPSIRLAAEDLEIARAGLQEAIGAFDTHLIANFEHSRTITPSPDANIVGQKKARQALIQTYRGVRDFRKGKNDGKIEIDDIDDKTGNVTGTNTIDLSSLGGGTSAFELDQLRQLQQQAAILDQAFGTATTGALNDGLIEQITGIERTNAKILRDLQNGLRKAISNFSIQETSRSNNTKYDVGLLKTFRSGITVNPRVNFDKSGLTNNVNAEIEITVPLGQGFGGRLLRAAEDAAYYDLLGSELQLRHKISDALLQTALAYWNCVAAIQNYVMLRQSENISDSFVELTNLRLESEEVAASEVAKARARNSTVVAQTIDAEFALLDARRQLALAMGLEGEELYNPPFAAGDIPTEIPLGNLSDGMAQMVAIALSARADRAAALQQVRSGKVLAEAAWHDIKPRFDFFFNAGLASGHDGAELYEMFSPYNDRWRGMSARGGFSFDWDIVNNPAKASYLRNLSFFNQSRINARDLDRVITNNVLLAAAEIRKRREQLAASLDAARFSRDVLKAERQRYNDGEGSLLDTLQVEEQYTNDLISVITVKLQFISAVARLRFESGSLLDPLSGHTPETVSFNASALTSIPDFDYLSLPAPLPTLETDLRKRPLPLFQKFRSGNIAEVKAHESAIKVSNWKRSMLDQPHLNPTAVTGAPVTVITESGKNVTVAPALAPVVPPPGPVVVTEEPVVVEERVDRPLSRPPPPPTIEAERAARPAERPKPLMKKLFGN